MSVEILREAATAIRDEHGDDNPTDFDRFMLAVADWLVEVYCAITGEWVDAYTATGPVGSSESGRALDVARAYLGRADA